MMHARGTIISDKYFETATQKSESVNYGGVEYDQDQPNDVETASEMAPPIYPRAFN